MKLSSAQKRHLRALGHHLKPVVRVGQHGLRESVLQEIELALDSHELVKIKIVADRDSRHAMGAEIIDRTGAEAIHSIGQMILIFRRNPEKPKVPLPSA
jgi:RNA-binding protein